MQSTSILIRIAFLAEYGLIDTPSSLNAAGIASEIMSALGSIWIKRLSEPSCGHKIEFNDLSATLCDARLLYECAESLARHLNGMPPRCHLSNRVRFDDVANWYVVNAHPVTRLDATQFNTSAFAKFDGPCVVVVDTTRA